MSNQTANNLYHKYVKQEGTFTCLLITIKSTVGSVPSFEHSVELVVIKVIPK